MLFIQGGTVQVLDCGDGLFGGLILDKGKPKLCTKTSVSLHSQAVVFVFVPKYVPFGHLLVVNGHKDSIFGGVADGVEFPQQEFHEFWPALLRHDRKTIDDNKGIQTLLEFHFILRLKIWWTKTGAC